MLAASIGIGLFLLHFVFHGMIWEALKMLIKHSYRKWIARKECDTDCKYD